MDVITITSPDWNIQAMADGWADDDTLTAAQARDCADAEYAWLINNTSARLRGWAFTGTGFSGPINKDAVTEILNLISDAVDYVLTMLDEIKAETSAVKVA